MFIILGTISDTRLGIIKFKYFVLEVDTYLNYLQRKVLIPSGIV